VELTEMVCLLQVVGEYYSVTTEEILGMGRGLYFLDFSECSIIDIEEGAFNSLTDLVSLKLSSNSIRKIYNEIFSSHRLQVLYLDGNGVEVIEDDAFARLPNLQKLYLQHNELETMSFTLPSSLNILDISHNYISSITTDLNKVRFSYFKFRNEYFKCLFNLMYIY
jgi:Leucine-rich repeat (LRR) protein